VARLRPLQIKGGETISMAGETDMKPHRATYHSVIGMLKYGAIGCMAIAALVIWLIAGHK
jgi:hypothetical protein